jgi:hypothetical protein
MSGKVAATRATNPDMTKACLLLLFAAALVAPACAADLDTGADSDHDAATVVPTSPGADAGTVFPTSPGPDAAVSIADGAGPGIEPSVADAGPSYVVIDDMERGAQDFTSPALVLGSWYVSVANPTALNERPRSRGAVQALSSPRGESRYAARLQGGGLIHGGDLFVDFHPFPINQNLGYVDFSPYTGIAFWARSAAGDAYAIMAIKDSLTNPTDEDYYTAGIDGQGWPSRIVETGDAWTYHRIPFSTLDPSAFSGSSDHRALAAVAIQSIHFLAGFGRGTFDLWIDDLVLTCDGPCPEPRMSLRCSPGRDQTCNGNPTISALQGHCNLDGTCTCMPGLTVDPATGRCGRP